MAFTNAERGDALKQLAGKLGASPEEASAAMRSAYADLDPILDAIGNVVGATRTPALADVRAEGTA